MARMKSVPVYFPKNECETIAIVNREQLKELMHHPNTVYFSIRSHFSLMEEKLYGVGFNEKIDDLNANFLLFNK